MIAFGKPLGLTDQLIELMVTAGWYRSLSYVINGARIELESWAVRFPEPD